jgi:hypothetical protein
VGDSPHLAAEDVDDLSDPDADSDSEFGSMDTRTRVVDDHLRPDDN